MLSYWILLILLPITYYSITKKTKFNTTPEFDKIEKEINEWLRSGTFQASEESLTKFDKISYIDHDEPLSTTYSEPVSRFTKKIGDTVVCAPITTEVVTAISLESYPLRDLDDPKIFVGTDEENKKFINLEKWR